MEENKGTDASQQGIIAAPVKTLIPTIPIESLKAMMKYIVEFKKALMVEGTDYVKDGKKQYTARSGFTKLALGFQISDEEPIIEELRYEDPQEFIYKFMLNRREQTVTIETSTYGFKAKVRVINLETGRHAWGEGACTVEELHQTNNMTPKWYHRCLATAKTRAYNRGVANIIGSAEVSAEEMGLLYPGDDNEDKSSSRRQEAAEDIKIDQFMHPGTLKAPKWDLRDELNRAPGIWERVGVETAVNWLVDSGIPEPLKAFTIKVDKVKLSVKAKKALDPEAGEALDRLLKDYGFKGNKGSWRLNKAEVVDK